MCLNPRKIYNRSIHYDLFKPLTLSVPCGKCEECRMQLVKEWFCRAYYEYAFSDNKMSFFYTLTYNNYFLPTYYGVPHFSRRHIQLFLKRLRRYLQKLGIRLRYIISCEFGELKGRSHYHALFFLNKEINPYYFFKLVEKAWSYGFVKPGNNVGVVDSCNGIQYVVKYIAKDYAQLNKMLPLLLPKLVIRYRLLMDYICHRWYQNVKFHINYDSDYIIHSYITGDSSCLESLEELRQFLLTKLRRIVRELTPFHLQSTKLGASIIDYCQKDLDKVPVLNTKGVVKMYNLPRYIKRLLWYDVIEGETSHKKDTFVLTEEGVRHSLEKLPSQIENIKNSFESTLLNVASLTSDVLPLINSQCKTDFKHFKDVIFYCQNFDLDLDVLAIYSHVFRGRVCTLDCDFTADFVKQYYIDYATSCLLDVSNFDFSEVYKNQSLIASLTHLTFNAHPYFQVYERALQILTCLSTLHHQFCSNYSIDKDINKRLLKQLLNPNV